MQRPELLHTSSKGGTIHGFEIEGGKRTFSRFLASYLGSSKFCADLEEAQAYLAALEALSEGN